MSHGKFDMKGYAPMLAKEVEAIIFPNGYSGIVVDKEEEKSYEEKYPDDGLDSEFDMIDTRKKGKKHSRKEYKFKKNEITVFNWGKKFNLSK